jgi:hypothetical protein
MPEIYNQVALDIMMKNGVAINDLYAFVLPQMDALQRPNNVHFNEEVNKALGEKDQRQILLKITRSRFEEQKKLFFLILFICFLISSQQRGITF